MKGSGWGAATRQFWELALLAHEAEQARNFIALISRVADRKRSVEFFLLSGDRHSKATGQAGRVIVLEGNSLAEPDAPAWLVFSGATRPFLYELSV